MYQINRPRPSKFGIRVNRLSRWSVRLLRQLNLGGDFDGVRGADISYSLSLDLDINTAADYAGEIAPAQLAEMFSELVALGIEISVKGDMP